MKLRLVLAALILLRATSSGAQADPRPEARGLAKQASTAYERGDLQSAARLYEEAYHLLHNDQIQYSLGRVYEGQGQLLRAKQAYERFIKGVPEADRELLEIWLACGL